MVSMEPLLREHLLAIAEAYCRGHGVKLSTASTHLHSNPRFFADLGKRKNPCGFTARKYDEIVLMARERWPESEPWPILQLPD